MPTRVRNTPGTVAENLRYFVAIRDAEIGRLVARVDSRLLVLDEVSRPRPNVITRKPRILA